jgi:LPXTG-site transpeptidase (sortase) family protein
MPRWLTTFLVLLILFAFVLPNPAQAGNATGNAIDSMVLFFRSAGNELSDTVALSDSSGDLSGEASSGSASTRSPNGGVSSGDGTYRTAPVDLAAVQAAVAPAPPPSDDGPVDTGGEASLRHSPPVELHLPTIGVSTGFVSLGLGPDGALQVPDTAHQAGWYRDAPTPGARGTAVVTAHVDWQQEKGVFHDLGLMRPGDELTVDRADGAVAVFRVTRIAEYAKSRFPTDEVYGGTDDAELRLITCSGPFDHATRSYTDNLVVYARMVGVRQA